MAAEVQVTNVPHAGPAEAHIGAAVVREGRFHPIVVVCCRAEFSRSTDGNSFDGIAILDRANPREPLLCLAMGPADLLLRELLRVVTPSAEMPRG